MERSFGFLNGLEAAETTKTVWNSNNVVRRINGMTKIDN